MLSFSWPWMILLLPLPLLLAKLSKIRKKENKITASIIFPKLEQLRSAFFNSKSKPSKLFNWRLVLCAIAWLCLVVSLMRPELIKDKTYAKNTGYDLMLAVDLSRSMETVDFRDGNKYISRIAATKKVVSNFVQHRTGDRIGLIVFAEQAFLTIPLTLDTTTVVKMLNNLLIGMAGESTAIGDAIGIGVQNLRKRPLTSRVLILLTDGADTASRIPPLEAAKIAANDKIKIYTIGVGDKLDEGLLEEIATMTGGTYSRVTSVDALEEVYTQIDSLEKSEASQRVLIIKTPLYSGFVLLALGCLIIFFLLSAKRYRYGDEFG